MAEPREKRTKKKTQEYNVRVHDITARLGDAPNQRRRVAQIVDRVAENRMSMDDAIVELDQVEEDFDREMDSKLPPLPDLVPVKGTRSRGGGGGGGGERAETGGRDALASAGVDLHEESQALMTTMALAGGPAARNRFRGTDQEAEPVFCARAAVRKLMKRILGSASQKADTAVEDLLCAAIETRMRQVLRLLASAARAAEDDPSEFGPVKVLYDPAVELKRLAGAEEVQQLKRDNLRKAELMKLAETDKDDVRVKAMLDDQARQRSAAMSSEAAIAIVRSGRAKAPAKPRTAAPSAAAAAVAVAAPSADVRAAQAKQAEGLALAPHEAWLVEEHARQAAATAAARRRGDAGRARAERRVGIKELLFVMDSDPFFRSVRMQSTLKSGFLGRGILAETRVLLRNE